MNVAAPRIRISTGIADLLAATTVAAAFAMGALGASLPIGIVLAVAVSGAWTRFGRGPALVGAGALLLTLGALVVWPAAPRAVGVPPTPAGVTAIALDGRVQVAWTPTTDASSYTVYRGMTKSSVTTA